MPRKINANRLNLTAILANADKTAAKHFPWRTHQQRMLPRKEIRLIQAAKKGKTQ